MGAIIFLVMVAFLVYARDTIEPIVIAAFIAYLINPAVMLLTRYTKMPRRAAVNVVYFTTVSLLVAIPATLTPIFFDELKGVVSDLLELIDEVKQLLEHPIVLGGQRFHLEQLGESLGQFQTAFSSPIPEKAFLLLENTSRGALWFVVIAVAVYLFLAEWPTIRDWLIGLPPDDYRGEMRELYLRVRAVWMSYLRGQILLMFIVGIVFTISWWIIGIPGALVLGVIAGLFTLVPDVGPFLAAVLAVGVALLEGSSWIPLSNLWVAAIVLIAYLVLINVKNFWLRPYIMGRSVHMNEGVVLVVILVATVLNGIMGALLVVPVLASVLVIVRYILARVAGRKPFSHTSKGEEMLDEPLPIKENSRPNHPRRRSFKINRN
jgi:predicted PurR-regulated permease PerM